MNEETKAQSTHGRGNTLRQRIDSARRLAKLKHKWLVLNLETGVLSVYSKEGGELTTSFSVVDVVLRLSQREKLSKYYIEILADQKPLATLSFTEMADRNSWHENLTNASSRKQQLASLVFLSTITIENKAPVQQLVHVNGIVYASTPGLEVHSFNCEDFRRLGKVSLAQLLRVRQL